MCLNYRPASHSVIVAPNSTPLVSLTRKITHSSIIASPSQFSTNSDGSQRKNLKRSRRSAQFSPNVSMRCFFHNSQQEQHHGAAAATSSPSWMKKDDMVKIKSRAKALAKLHYMRSKTRTQSAEASSTKSSVTIGDATRYEIKGESLRGMEYLTDIANGRKRRRVQEKATQTVVVEQQEQLIQHVLDSTFTCGSISTVDQVKKALKMDTSKLAKVYGAKTKEALSYARSVAQEDADIAAAILAEDLQDSSLSSRTVAKKTIKPVASTNQRTTAELIKTLLQPTMSRHRLVATW